MSGTLYAVTVEGCGAWYNLSEAPGTSITADFRDLGLGRHMCHRLQTFYNHVDPETVSYRVIGHGGVNALLKLIASDITAFNSEVPYDIYSVRLPGYSGWLDVRRFGELFMLTAYDEDPRGTPYTLVDLCAAPDSSRYMCVAGAISRASI